MSYNNKLIEAYLQVLNESNLDYHLIQAKVENSDHDRKTIDWFKEQIKKGIHEPILVNSEKEVLDGNHRLKAYQELNIEPPLLYEGERNNFYQAAEEADYDGIKMIKLMIENGTATKIN